MKFMNMKRFASTVMAGALAVSLAVPAFAAGNSTNITGTYRAITLNVAVPTTGSAIINPYGLPFELGAATVSGQQITTGAPLLVQNKSSVPLSVSASVVGTVKGNFEFSAAAVNPTTEIDNKANVVFQMFEAPGVTAANATDMDVLNPMFAALEDDDALNSTVIGTTATNAADITVLKQANADGDVVDGGAAFFRLSGTVAKKPTTAWATTDGFTAKVSFTFEPGQLRASAGTIATGTLTNDNTLDGSIDTSTILTLTPTLPSGVTVDEWTWTSSDVAAATVTVDSTDSKKATAQYVAAGSTTITVSGTGSDNVAYSATINITCS